MKIQNVYLKFNCMKKLFTSLLIMCMVIFSASAYDYSIVKSVVNENFLVIAGSGEFDLNSASATYTKLTKVGNGTWVKFRGMVNFGEFADSEGAITLTYSNDLIPADSLSTTELSGGCLLYTSDAADDLL